MLEWTPESEYFERFNFFCRHTYRPMLMAFMFQIKINIDEGGRSSLFLEAK